MEQNIDLFIQRLNDEFTVDNLNELLVESEIMESNAIGRNESFSKLVFWDNENEEIYSHQEIALIEKIDNIIIFPDFEKKFSKGKMKCRYLGVDLSEENFGLYSAVLFMKIVIKAFPGFNIFIIKLKDGLHLGIQKYDKVDYRNCTLCEANRFKEILESIIWEKDNNFMDYYFSMIEYISPIDTSAKSYDDSEMMKEGIQYDYIEMLLDLENKYNVSTDDEIRRYLGLFNDNPIISFKQLLDDTVEELKDIKSDKVNTLEMLFDAEEISAIHGEKYIQEELDLTLLTDNEIKDDDIKISSNDNPEEMIKKLRKKYGIL